VTGNVCHESKTSFALNVTSSAKKVPYCGTYVVGPDQTPRNMRDVYSGPTIFVAHEHLKKTFLSLTVQC